MQGPNLENQLMCLGQARRDDWTQKHRAWTWTQTQTDVDTRKETDTDTDTDTDAEADGDRDTATDADTETDMAPMHALTPTRRQWW